MHRMTSDWPWTLNPVHLTVKGTLYTLNMYPWGSRPAFFETQGCWKSEMYRITSDWPWTLNCQKYHVYTQYLPPEARISGAGSTQAMSQRDCNQSRFPLPMDWYGGLPTGRQHLVEVSPPPPPHTHTQEHWRPEPGISPASLSTAVDWRGGPGCKPPLSIRPPECVVAIQTGVCPRLPNDWRPSSNMHALLHTYLYKSHTLAMHWQQEFH